MPLFFVPIVMLAVWWRVATGQPVPEKPRG